MGGSTGGWGIERLETVAGSPLARLRGLRLSKAPAPQALQEALCQVAVTLTYATGCGHALIGRALHLPEARRQ